MKQIFVPAFVAVALAGALSLLDYDELLAQQSSPDAEEAAKLRS